MEKAFAIQPLVSRDNREASFSQRLASAAQGAMAMARKSKGPMALAMAMAQGPMAMAQGPKALAQAQIITTSKTGGMHRP